MFVSAESPLLAAALRPSLHVPQAASAFQPHCFYSISRHYQRRYDHRVHSAAGEQWRRLAVFSLVCHLYCPTPLTGIKWGLSIRSALLYSTSPPLWSLKDTQGHLAKIVFSLVVWEKNTQIKDTVIALLLCTPKCQIPQEPKSTIRRSALQKIRRRKKIAS